MKFFLFESAKVPDDRWTSRAPHGELQAF